MLNRGLVAFVFALVIGTEFIGRQSEEGSRTHVASPAAQAEASLQGIHTRLLSETFRAEDTQETEKEDRLAIGPSFLPVWGRACPYQTETANDVALWPMQNQQWRTARVLQKLQSALGQSVAETEAQISQQEQQTCSVHLIQEHGAGQDSRRRDTRLERISSQCPLDTFNAFKQSCEQKDGITKWRWEQGNTGRSICGSTNLRSSNSGISDSRGGKDFRAFEGSANSRSGFDRSDGTTEAEVGSEATTGPCCKGTHTWSSQSSYQAQDAGHYRWQQGQAVGPGVEDVCGCNYAESEATCRVVPKMQGRLVRRIQSQDCGAQRVETRDEFSIFVNAGSHNSSASHSRRTRCRGAIEEHRRCDLAGRDSGNSRSHRRGGRLGHGGPNGFWSSSEEFTEAAQELQGGYVTDQGGPAAPEAQDAGCQGCQESRQRSDCMTQKDSGVMQSRSSTDNFVREEVVAGWWQDFAQICQQSHTWQQYEPESNGVNELKCDQDLPEGHTSTVTNYESAEEGRIFFPMLNGEWNSEAESSRVLNKTSNAACGLEQWRATMEHVRPFPRKQVEEFEPQHFVVGASDDFLLRQVHAHQVGNDHEVASDLSVSDRSSFFGSAQFADCGILESDARDVRHHLKQSTITISDETEHDDFPSQHSALRSCKEGNMDLLGLQAEKRACLNVSGVEGHSDLDTPHGPNAHSPLEKCGRRVNFDDKVDIVCYQTEKVLHVCINMDDQVRCCRSLWHMHGQIAEFKNFQMVLTQFAMDPVQHFSRVEVSNSNSDETSEHPGSMGGNDRRDANSDQTISGVIDEIKSSKLPIFADTWFLAVNRFQVCVRPRELRLKSSSLVNAEQLQRECKELWQELDNGGAVSIQVLGGIPTRRSAIRLHIIITQEPSPVMDTIIFHSESLPPLFKYRAVMFPRGIDVNTFFEKAQVEGACQAGMRACFTRCWEQGHEIFRSNLEPIWVPANKYVEGDIRLIHDDAHSDGETGDPDSETSTTAVSHVDDADSDENSFMSGGPPLFQLDDYMQQMVETAGMEDVHMHEENHAPGEPHLTDILYAPQHMGHLQDEIDRLREVQNAEDEEWTAATFGLGLVDLGRRDVQFNPYNLRGLLEAILSVWSDHSQYGNLVVYNVHPQPLDFLGPRTVAVLVVVDLPESLDMTIRNVLVVEQAAHDVGARPQPYGARLTCEASEREILAQLQLHLHCPPFALRPCHVRLGEMMLEKDHFYEFDHGSLCRTWIGKVHSQVLQAEQTVYDAEQFFLQAHTFMENSNPSQVIICRVHGITPQNRPMGSRDVHIDPVWLYDLEWIERMKMLWPFDADFVGIYFVKSATEERQLESTIFHFIARCGHNEGLPVLVRQQLVAVEEVPNEPQDTQEYWAISIPSGEIGFHVVANFPSHPFWFEHARTQRIYPHLAVNGVRMRDIRQHWMPGDFLQARFLVWQRHHVLSMLVGMASERSDESHEFTSFLQIGQGKMQMRENSHTQIDEAFEEACCTIRDQGIQALKEDASVSVIMGESTKLWDHEVDPPVVQTNCDENQVIHEAPMAWSISTLQDCLHRIQARGTEGINSDFAIVPHLHPHARVAAEWVSEAPSEVNTWHIFTDGSAKQERATWAMVILQELHVKGATHYARVGYAAGEVTDEIGEVDQNAMDAEATAIIAMIEFALANCDKPNVEIYCHFDAWTVGFGAMGASAIPCKRDSSSERQKAARILMTILERRAEVMRGSCKGLHVCAHQGNPWNEMVDSIAKEVWKGWRPRRAFHFKSGPLLRHQLADWAWIEAAPSHELPGLERILQNETPRTEKGILDATLQGTAHQNFRSIDSAKIKVATANVGTMLYDSERSPGVSSKAMELLRQFEENEVHIIGVQESRANKTQCIESGPYTRMIVAGEKGNAGVELWVNGKAIATTFQADFNPRQDLCVWYHNKRIIAARCNFGQVVFDIMVLYAPQKGRPQQEILDWWDELEDVVAKRDRNVNLICLGDLNCKVGSISTCGIGEHAGDLEDEGGERFRAFCDGQNLIVPSTFAHWHHGVTNTFVSAHNTQSRLDYIAISAACQTGVVESYVDVDMDMMNGDRDHRPLVMMLAIQCCQKQAGWMKKCNSYDRNAARARAVKQQGTMLDSFPEQEWSADVNLHWSNLRQHMQEKAVKWFPCPKRKPRQLYFSDRTWNLLCDRKDLRKQHREIQRQLKRHVLHRIFHAWKGNDEIEGQRSLRDLELSVLRQQEAVILEARRNLDVRFRMHKTRDWKEWVDKHLSDKLAHANSEGNDKLYKILQPKQMIAKHCGKLVKPLPGLRNHEGEWQFSREDIALGWQQQFGQIEHAEVVQFEDLVERSNPDTGPRTVQNLKEIPTLRDVEKALRGLNDAKATGLDGLGAELFQVECAKVARRIYPLVLKMGLRCQGIPELSGGWLLPLFKGKGSAQQMLGYRAILLEPVIARAMSKAWRPKLTKGLESTAVPMQWGGRAGLSIEALHLQVQLWQANARRRRESQGIIFVDIKAAFYSVVKQLLTDEGSKGQRVREVFEKMRLPESVWESFAAHVEDCSLVRQATGSAMLAQSTQAMLSHTWFAVPGASEASGISAPMTGSRPGDPNADLLFGLLMARVLATLHIRASQAEMPLFPDSSNDLRVPNCVTWVDDLAISVSGTADDVVTRTMNMLALVRDVMLEYGLQLSFGAGKTAAMITFHGKGAGKARQSFENRQDDRLTILTEHQGAAQVPIVTHYKHLGGFITKTGSKFQEIRIRSAATMAKLKPLRKILKSPELAIEKRRLLLQSMGMSVLTLHSGT